jgi:hypothetical protein
VRELTEEAERLGDSELVHFLAVAQLLVEGGADFRDDGLRRDRWPADDRLTLLVARVERVAQIAQQIERQYGKEDRGPKKAIRAPGR